MNRLAIIALLFAAGCCCFEPRGPEDGPGGRLPALPGEALPGAGGRFDEGMERLLGPDRRFDPDLRPPFTNTPEPRLPTAPRAEDPPWRNR